MKTEHYILDNLFFENDRQRELILNNITELVVYQDKDMKALWVNDTACKSVKLPLKEIVGRHCYEVWHNRTEPCEGCAVLKAMKTGLFQEFEITSPDNRSWLIKGYPVRDADGNVVGAVELTTDITETKKTKEKTERLNRELLRTNRKLQRLALKDPLTGIYNHRYFEEIVESEFYRAKRYNQSISLMMIDIDYFRSINDVYGHRFGDLVLKQFAKKLRRLVRLHDYVVRFGGEEFVVIMPESDKVGCFSSARRILDSMRVCKFGDLKNSVKLRLSVAVVSYPDDKLFRGMDFIPVAESVLNRVKECGGDRVFSLSDIEDKNRRLRGQDKKSNVKYLKQRLLMLTKKSNQSLVESIFAFAKTIELKDQYTGDHVEKTVRYARQIAREIGLPEREIICIEQASMLHDLGKIGISEKILLKKGKLTGKEFEKIKEHPKIGVDIIRPIQFLHGLIPLILYHHERWDGKGYPFGLKGEEIPVGARIIAIADVYQALTSDRPYRKAMSKEEAVRIIEENSGSQFEPRIANIFLNILKKGS